MLTLIHFLFILIDYDNKETDLIILGAKWRLMVFNDVNYLEYS